MVATLLVDVKHPGSQEDLVSNWEPAHSLVEDAVCVAEIAPCLPALAIACLPFCLWQGDAWSVGICLVPCSVSGPGCASG